MFKKMFYHGISAGILSAAACIIYNRIYFFATEADFSKVINIPVITGINLFACLLAAAGYWAFKKLLKKNAEIFSCVARGVGNHALPGPEACLNLTIHFTLIST